MRGTARCGAGFIVMYDSLRVIAAPASRPPKVFQGIMHTPLGGVNTPQFLYDTPPVLASWGCVRGVFLDGSAGIWGVFREVVSILLRSLVHEPIIHVGLRAYQQFTTQPIKPKSHQCQCRIYPYKL